MTSEPLSDIKLSIMIDAPLDVVWRNMTETDRVPLWLGCLKYEKRLGQTFYMQQDADKRAANDIEGATHCEVLELSEPERFVFSWFLPGTPKTTVTIALAAVAENRTSVEFKPQRVGSVFRRRDQEYSRRASWRMGELRPAGS